MGSRHDWKFFVGYSFEEAAANMKGRNNSIRIIISFFFIIEASLSNNASPNTSQSSSSTAVTTMVSTTSDENKKLEPEKTNCPICSEVFAQDKIEVSRNNSF